MKRKLNFIIFPEKGCSIKFSKNKLHIRGVSHNGAYLYSMFHAR